MSPQLPGATRPVVPFVGIAVLAFVATGLESAGTNWGLVADTGLGAVVLSVIASLVPWSSVPASAVLVLPIAADVGIALLRHAQGGSASGYSPLAILPVAWVGLTRGRRAVALLSVCTTLMFALPLVIFGAPLYPATGWRNVVLWTAVAIVMGVGANLVVAAQRRQAGLLRRRAVEFDRLVEAQTSIATADLAVATVMTTAAEEALALTGAEGACIELLDGDEVFCAAAAGVAVDYIGLRLKANASITGECFRTQQVLICSDSESDTRVGREACRLVGARSLIVVPLLNGDDMKGVLIIWSATARDFKGYESQLLSLLGTMIGAALVRAELIAQLTDEAVTDQLTGLPNRRDWYQQLDRALARARRTRQPLSILMLDLDSFKEVNDSQGHAAGDRLLQAAGAGWTSELRATDLLGRVGGDEFAVILELTDSGAAHEVIGRLDQSLASPHRASTGLAVWDGIEDAAALVARADADMYEHKRAHALVAG